MCWCVCLCYLSNRSIILQIHRHLEWKTIEKHNKEIQEHKKLIRSSPYPPGLHLQSSFPWWPYFIVSWSRELQWRSSIWVSWNRLAWQGGSWIAQVTRAHRLFSLPSLWPLWCDWSSHGWLESLKLSGARCYLWLVWPSVFFPLFASLVLLFSLFCFWSSSPCVILCYVLWSWL